MPVRAAVPVAVVKRQEHHAVASPADAYGQLHAAAPGLDADHVPLGDPQFGGVALRQLDPRLRRRTAEPTGAAGLGTGVEVVDGTPGRAHERVVPTRLFGRRHVLRGPEQRPAFRAQRVVLRPRGGAAGEQVTAVALTHVRVRGEHGIGVQAVTAVRVLVVARPRDTAPAAQPVVGQAGVVAQPPSAALLPRLERALRVAPLDQRIAVAVSQVHTTGVVEEDIEVGACFPGWLHCLLRQVHGAVGVGERPGLLTPGRSGQHDVGELRGLGQEDVLHHEEKPVLGEDLAHTPQFR